MDFNYRGDYDQYADYYVGDVVKYQDAWYHLQKPAEYGTPPTDTQYWNRASDILATAAEMTNDAMAFEYQKIIRKVNSALAECRETIAPPFLNTAHFEKYECVYHYNSSGERKLYMFKVDHSPGDWDYDEVIETDLSNALYCVYHKAFDEPATAVLDQCTLDTDTLG